MDAPPNPPRGGDPNSRETIPLGEHARRLEALWQGEFGDAYTERNAHVAAHRLPFWKEVLSEHPCQRILEVGCNLGANLRWIATLMPTSGVFGVDVNESALSRLRTEVPTVNANWSIGRDLPFRDRYFDMVFTTGVLIHQPPTTLPLVMAEIVRCSRRYVLCGEYYADTLTEVPYRGQSGALYKRDYGALYQELFPELAVIKKGFLGRDTGWDDVTYWLFERPQ
ncbi:MAG: methyltransferase domain-containing protein [Deltaproteobacteria bacterium]|nr:methyltransferase domain-containing protein [Deltaproteobacteria bacterium]